MARSKFTRSIDPTKRKSGPPSSPVGPPPSSFRSLFFRRGFLQWFLAKAHQHEVYGDAVQPGGKSGVAAKHLDLAQYRKEGLLCEVLGLRGISRHAQAEGVDTA